MNFERHKDPYKSLQIGQLAILWNTLVETYRMDAKLFKPISANQYKYNGWNIIVIKQIHGWNIKITKNLYLGIIFKDGSPRHLDTDWFDNSKEAEKMAKELIDFCIKTYLLFV